MPNETTAKGDGLHCVYGKCEGWPHSNRPCHPGCYFQMTAITELEALRRSIGVQKDAE